jgi:hypothetical protein
VTENTEPAGELSTRFDLMSFTDSLIGDLRDLRGGKISTKDAMARAELAKQVLRSVQLVVTARKFIEGAAKLAAPANG